ncbi:hypothetical protein PISMIDRAFT_688018 [Pisolithus microcarpus 441]|uniref:Uncharacterized protein n=1 Tax=Pisolithus microcarpus 441 TaxID=765257 RepID=A0A0C9Z2U3_9AGAM|nr:hypothetical protein PISMIDRAFT_688377 [Pisolithus microcarpus 441]KIK14368.1 hypothetical protein PISMIDRAFT_688018 [Pisolithus microcarpus 441]
MAWLRPNISRIPSNPSNSSFPQKKHREPWTLRQGRTRLDISARHRYLHEKGMIRL